MKSVLKIFVAASLAGLTFSSCRKDLEDSFESDQLVALDHNQAENETDDVGNMEDQTLEANAGSLKAGRIAVDGISFDSNSCAKVTIIPRDENVVGSKGKITIDFGSGCLCKDGRMRKGKIISEFTDRFRVKGAVIITSYDGYGVTKKGGLEYMMFDNSSEKTTTTLDAPASIEDNSTILFRRVVNMKFTMPDGSAFSNSGDREVKLELGKLGNRYDNVHTILAGVSESQGTDRKGMPFFVKVDKDVVRKAECSLQDVFKPVSGQITIKHTEKTKVVNYGNGNCDNNVDITINGRTRTVSWQRWQ